MFAFPSKEVIRIQVSAHLLARFSSLTCAAYSLALIGTMSWTNFVFPSLRDELRLLGVQSKPYEPDPSLPLANTGDMVPNNQETLQKLPRNYHAKMLSCPHFSRHICLLSRSAELSLVTLQ
ncbi:hypothetical protein VNO80_18591 [Phaseolus coccineus]|uniref:Uncharacterized protein n=1 Tax=Phaseolus coccineus TaxID=3886 RepID=A0AAN9QZK7_PHACN